MVQTPAKCMVLLTSDGQANHLPRPLVEGIEHSLAANRLRLERLHVEREWLAHPQRLLAALKEHLADGIFLNLQPRIPKPLDELIANLSIPRVWIDSNREWNAVRPDDVGAGRMLTEHLIELGHRHIAYDGWIAENSEPNRHHGMVDRCAGYLQAMRDARLPPDLLPGCEFSSDEAVRSAARRRRFAQLDRPTAVISNTHGDLDADVRACGLEVPRVISLAYFRDADDASGRNAAATSVAFDWRELGSAATRMLLAQHESPFSRAKSRALPFTLVPGSTCARRLGSGEWRTTR